MVPNIQSLEPKIRQILSAPGTDLATISAKRVRKHLLEVDSSLTPDFIREKKDEIDDIIARVYEQISASVQGASTDAPDADDADDPGTSKRKRGHASDDDLPAAPKKTKKTKSKQEKTDEELARQLQNEINGRARSSRAGASAKKPNGPKRGKKAKAAAADSDVDDAESGGDGKKKRGGGGFKKEYNLSPPLATLLGVDKLSRPQIVKQLWTHIKQNNMQNPENKKEIICDDSFRAIFKVDRIDMFKMNKELGQHLYDTEVPAAS